MCMNRPLKLYISIRNTELDDSPKEHLEAGKIQHNIVFQKYLQSESWWRSMTSLPADAAGPCHACCQVNITWDDSTARLPALPRTEFAGACALCVDEGASEILSNHCV